MKSIAILIGAFCAVFLFSNSKAAARSGTLTYEEQIILCSAFHIVDQYADYPIELSSIHALDFSQEFHRLIPDDKKGEDQLLRDQEQVIRNLMRTFLYGNTSENQKYEVAERVYAECQSAHLALLSSRGQK